MLHEYGFHSFKDASSLSHDYSAVVLLVSHKEYANLKYAEFTSENSIIYDVKGVLDKEMISGRL